MRTADLLTEAFDRLHDIVHAAADGLDPGDLGWRPDPAANSVGWLVWHLARVRDDHISDLSGQEQTWVAQEWAPRFGLPAGSTGIGYGDSADDVAALRPADAGTLLAYHDRVAEATRDYLGSLGDADLDHVVDDSFDPPVTVGVRLVSVLSDDLQHAGQASYLRGLLDRRG